MNNDELNRLLGRFTRLTLGVVGDFCLDAYWLLDGAEAERSTETGKRTHAVRRQFYSLGGAGNVANNAVALGVKRVHGFGVIGPDLFGRQLLELLAVAGVRTSGMVVQEKEWDTCAYVKPFAGPDERERLDFGRFNLLARTSADALLAELERALGGLDGLIINQQIRRGIHNEELIARLQALLDRGVRGPVLIDARDVCDRYANVIFKLNAREAARMCGRGPTASGVTHRPGTVSGAGGAARGHGPEQDKDVSGGSPEQGKTTEHGREVPDSDLAEFARRIHSRSGREVIITRGDRGMLAFDGARLCEVPGIPHDGPIDPVGAGDTAAAAITASLAAGASLAQAIEIGNYAAGVVVRKLRQTGTATPEEILAMAAMQAKGS